MCVFKIVLFANKALKVVQSITQIVIFHFVIQISTKDDLKPQKEILDVYTSRLLHVKALMPI